MMVIHVTIEFYVWRKADVDDLRKVLSLLSSWERTE